MSNTVSDPPNNTPKPTARKKIRPTYSCLSCHKRKVKCDRVKPCGACCLRGTPSECEYGTSKRDRHFIHQSTRIENLVRTCESLKQQLAEARRLASLPVTKDDDDDEEEEEEEEGELPHRPYPIAESSDDEIENEDEVFDQPSVSSSSPSSSMSAGSQTRSVNAIRDRQPRKSSTYDLSSQKSTALVSHPAFPRSPLHDKARLTDPALSNAVIELFVDRLIDNFSPRNIPGTIALREASSMRVFSPLLCKAFEAASLTFAGRHDGNRYVELAGHTRYVRMLRMLQNSLQDGEGRNSTEVLVVVLLSTIIEAFKQTSQDSILKHQLGGLELLKARSPYRHRHGIERSLFVDLRLYWTPKVTAALAHRQPTFMASKEWLTVPWPTEAPAKDILHRLLDVAVHIPGYLAQVDELSARLRSYDGNQGAMSPGELDLLQSAVWGRATELQSQLHIWKSVYADRYCPGAPWEDMAEATAAAPALAQDFPVFRCRNASTMQVFVPKSLVFPDLLHATSLTFYWALFLVISPRDTGLVTVLGLPERYQYACNICRSMKYYVEHIPGSLVSRIMFVLRAAFDAFADDTLEKEFIAQLFSFIGRKFQFPVFTNKCTSSSVRSS
ncbi:hypothetical protein ARAM_001834 [Aspergillus rambellii]|uniref:Zn(2)-C6 fungal-type domain-containing protein n=1 Tax=Aspergillus rambellii TaxID=308745 RepID=A0A0F8WHL2_9EURO|nr:hypothetical protein ARAM_001834 [Aspergillus rambellii]